MSETETIERLKREWQEAKRAADSLSADFRTIEAARERVSQARKRYIEALHSSNGLPT